ncbi:fimbria/pilus outer membrane usher protein [Photobacterium sp. TY1-4]|nr:fimbria/pilus outer membrane usher protein [Photobacterium sp. TY1-4]
MLVLLGGWVATGYTKEPVPDLQVIPLSPEVYSEALFNTMTLQLELIINQNPTGVVTTVERQENVFVVPRHSLINAGLVAEHLPEAALVNVTALSDVRVNYLQASQQLALEVPTSWLPVQFYSAHENNRYLPAKYGRGGLINYRLFGTRSTDGQEELSLSHDFRAFSEWGIVSSTGVFKHQWQEADTDKSRLDSYTRFDSRYEYADQDRLVRWEVGDFITRPLAWTQPVRMAGIQFSHDFSMRPDIVTAPLPAFYGAATAPTTLELFVNGLKTDELQVEAGPYVINNIPMISGAGEATVIATDIQGRQTVITTPFFLASQLLKAGYASYNISVGAMRDNFGLKSNDYADGALTGAWRYGLSDSLTLELQTEASDDLLVSGSGLVASIFRLGTLDTAVRVSRYQQRSGYAWSAGYSYQAQGMNISLRTQREAAVFTDLSQVNVHPSMPSDSQSRVTQATFGMSLGAFGSLSGGYFDIDQNDSRSRNVNLTYSYTLPFQINMSVSANQEIGGDTVALAQFTLPLGPETGNIGLSLKRENEGRVAGRVSYSRHAPIDGGWGEAFPMISMNSLQTVVSLISPIVRHGRSCAEACPGLPGRIIILLRSMVHWL